MKDGGGDAVPGHQITQLLYLHSLSATAIITTTTAAISATIIVSVQYDSGANGEGDEQFKDAQQSTQWPHVQNDVIDVPFKATLR